jgi:hypothetical protein
MKLKTLKELPRIWGKRIEIEAEDAVRIKILRKEAIKCHKKIGDKDFLNGFVNARYFIEWFFNLTEEDLK